MSFFNTIRGLTSRSSKRNKTQHKDAAPSSGLSNLSAGSQSQIYSNTTGSSMSLKKAQAITKAGGKPLFLCKPFVLTALVKGNFKTIVQLPKYVEYGEWVALNVFEFFTQLNQFYGVIAEYVTPEAYPTMNAGPGVDYLWVDSNKKTVVLPAGAYIDYVLTWINNKFNDQTLFPTKNGVPFPPNYLKDLKNICRQMFRIFAHIYHNHFDKILHLSLEAYWNSLFAHFISFVKTFDMIERKELEPLIPLIEILEENGKIINE